MRKYTRIIIAGLIFSFSCISAFSHPHVFIENTFEFVFDDNGLYGIRIKWIFDEMFSASVIMDFDINKNGIFDESEIKAVEKGAFSNLENYNYYLYISIDNTETFVSKIENFNAEITDNRIVYYFFIPLHIKALKKETIIQAGCYDSSYFCQVSYPDINPVVLEDDSCFECSWEIKEDKENVYWVTIIPKVVVLNFRTKDE